MSLGAGEIRQACNYSLWNQLKKKSGTVISSYNMSWYVVWCYDANNTVSRMGLWCNTYSILISLAFVYFPLQCVCFFNSILWGKGIFKALLRIIDNIIAWELIGSPYCQIEHLSDLMCLQKCWCLDDYQVLDHIYLSVRWAARLLKLSNRHISQQLIHSDEFVFNSFNNPHKIQ